MCAMELVSDRATKATIDKASIGKLQQATYEAGVMVRVSGPNVILSPPLILTDDETAKIVSALDTGFSSL
jgi:adenosylmethionine-8-amino-7-oxononanoate aminotransferase